MTRRQNQLSVGSFLHPIRNGSISIVPISTADGMPGYDSRRHDWKAAKGKQNKPKEQQKYIKKQQKMDKKQRKFICFQRKSAEKR